MAQYWREAGMSFLRYGNLCAEYTRKVLKESARLKLATRNPYVMVKSEWEAGKPLNKIVIEAK